MYINIKKNQKRFLNQNNIVCLPKLIKKAEVYSIYNGFGNLKIFKQSFSCNLFYGYVFANPYVIITLLFLFLLLLNIAINSDYTMFFGFTKKTSKNIAVCRVKPVEFLITRGMKHTTNAIKDLGKTTVSVLDTKSKFKPITGVIKDKIQIKKLENYPNSFFNLVEKNQQKITVEALDAIVRGGAAYSLIKKNPQEVKEIIIAYTYSSGLLNENLKTITNLLALEELKNHINDVSNFSSLLPKTSFLDLQVLDELKKLKVKDFPKFDEALTIIDLNKSLPYPIMFLNDEFREYIRKENLFVIDNTRNTDWDGMLVLTEKLVTGFTVPFQYRPVDIKNTTYNMGPKDEIYRNSEMQLLKKYPTYFSTLMCSVENKIIKADQKTRYSLVLLQENLKRIETEYSETADFTKAISNWNKLQVLNHKLIIKEQLPFNLLSFTPEKDIESMIPKHIWQAYRNSYDNFANMPAVQKVIVSSYYKNMTKDERPLEEIFENMGKIFDENDLFRFKGNIINDNQGFMVKEIIQTCIKTKIIDDVSI